LLVFAFLLAAQAAFVVFAATVAHTQESQAKRMYRIGFLRGGPPPKAWVEGFRQGLRDFGYREGQNIVVEYRDAHGTLDRVSSFAAELIHHKVDILVVGGTESARLAKDKTTMVPIVFATSGDPVGSGLVSSLAHPGGNVPDKFITRKWEVAIAECLVRLNEAPLA